MARSSVALDGKIALVTGASRGIGRSIAVALAKAGADVAVNFKARSADAEEVHREIERHGRRATVCQADVSVAAEVARMVGQIEVCFGPVGVLVNNAGITRPQPVAEISEQDWDEVLAVNLKSVFLGRLYSFWVSREASGASGGYVAAGGPGFSGPVDTAGTAAYQAAVK